MTQLPNWPITQLPNYPITQLPDYQISSCVRRPDHDLLDPDVRRAVRDAVGLCRLAFGVAAGAEHLPRLLAADQIQVGPEVSGDRVVGDVGHHPRDLAVLDPPKAVAAELAVVALLVDRVAAAAVDQHAVPGVGDHLRDVGRSRGPGFEADVGHAQEG